MRNEKKSRGIVQEGGKIRKKREKLKKIMILNLKKKEKGCNLYDNQDSGRFCGEFHSTAPHHPRIK